MSDGLPLVVSTAAVRAVKLAEVRGARRPRMHPVGRYRRRHYDHLEAAQAHCHRRGHAAPALECSCGFHAVGDAEALGDVTHVLADTVLLDVELSGAIVEHERGFRAERQRIVGVRFPATCSWCDGPALTVVPGRRWRSACARCGAERRALVRADATGVLGIDVGFGATPREAGTARTFGRVRAALVALLTLGWLAVVAAAVVPGWATLVAAACAGGSTIVAGIAWRARSARTHEPCFVAQCGLLVVATAVVTASCWG